MCPDRQLFVLAATMVMALAVGPAHAGSSYIVSGGDTGVFHQHVSVWTSDNDPITDATVTINGVTLPFVSGARYSQDLPEELQAGDPFELVVQIGPDTITCTDVVPAKPVIMAPLDGASIDQGSSLLVEWTSDSDPDRFQISAYPCDGNCRVTVGGDVRSLELDTSGFPTTEPVKIRVYAYAEGSFTGPADPSSNLNLRHLGIAPDITVISGTPTTQSSWSSLKARFQ